VEGQVKNLIIWTSQFCLVIEINELLLMPQTKSQKSNKSRPRTPTDDFSDLNSLESIPDHSDNMQNEMKSTEPSS
jgi:hypothetical protein